MVIIISSSVIIIIVVVVTVVILFLKYLSSVRFLTREDLSTCRITRSCARHLRSSSVLTRKVSSDVPLSGWVGRWWEGIPEETHGCEHFKQLASKKRTQAPSLTAYFPHLAFLPPSTPPPPHLSLSLTNVRFRIKSSLPPTLTLSSASRQHGASLKEPAEPCCLTAWLHFFHNLVTTNVPTAHNYVPCRSDSTKKKAGSPR